MTAINPDEPIQTAPAGTSFESGHMDGRRALTEHHVLDTMNVELHSRLAALESEEYRNSECYVLGDRVVASSVFWVGVGIVVVIITLVLWL